MRIKVLASGSKGNSTYIECGSTKILIDAGISFLQIKNSLSSINVDVNDIDIILITHSHADHIKGLATLLKRTNITLYTTEEVFNDITKTIDVPSGHIIDKYFMFKDVLIDVLPLSHDVSCNCYIIKYNEHELVYITDTGYLNKRYFPRIKNKDVYIIEANHDEVMLMNGPYPFILKQRILSDKGHLSNEATANILLKLVGSRTKYIFLAHISEHNNTKELALKTVTDKLDEINFNHDNIILTDQYISLEMVEV